MGAFESSLACQIALSMKIFAVLYFLLIGLLFNPVEAEAARAKILFLYSDKGLDSEKTDKTTRKQFKKIGKYMDPILIKKLKNADFKVKLLERQEDFKPKNRRFYLYVTLLEYERNGDVPFYLKVYFELSEDGATPLMKETFEIESKRSWKKCAIKAAKLISDALVQNRMDIVNSDEAKVVKRSSRYDDKDIPDKDEPEDSNPVEVKNKPAEDDSENEDPRDQAAETSVSETPRDRMAKLTELYDSGMISEEEYFKKKDELLSDL